MICRLCFGDQQISHVWKLGMDMKDNCDRVIITKMVRDGMEERRVEFRKAAERMATLAKQIN